MFHGHCDDVPPYVAIHLTYAIAGQRNVAYDDTNIRVALDIRESPQYSVHEYHEQTQQVRPMMVNICDELYSVNESVLVADLSRDILE
jgi:hypothetical protein